MQLECRSRSCSHLTCIARPTPQQRFNPSDLQTSPASFHSHFGDPHQGWGDPFVCVSLWAKAFLPPFPPRAPHPSLRTPGFALPAARTARPARSPTSAAHLPARSKGPPAAREARSCYQTHGGAGRKACICPTDAFLGLYMGDAEPCLSLHPGLGAGAVQRGGAGSYLGCQAGSLQVLGCYCRLLASFSHALGAEPPRVPLTLRS